ncbi:carbohydrate ABC transporter permease [Paenibacillus sp. IB182496]|uniref:Carbohydrate ABC transporter permease n=1 Tax=Paenibacillus sabuli TaxID=2772509 RepID=A0A927GUQ3_9BACL|nr:carbohydrate ABC transporter permease [Paenibacillus sabuli]MBD2848596.1 carbohydrate ABC transporter permease [Paenibacillus sabuli]
MTSHERGILSHSDLRRPRMRLAYGAMLAAIALMIASMLYPFTVTIFNGLKLNTDLNAFPPHWLPRSWHFENYATAWRYIALPGFLGNTLKIFVGNMVATVLVTGLAAYSLSRLRVPRRQWIYLFFMITLFIPPTTYIIPNFMNLKSLGLLNTFWAFWLPAGASAFYLLVLKNFFDSISMELFESARIDGASEPRCFFQLALPLSVPIFATLAIFVFATAWNDWYWPSLVMHSNRTYPLATAVYKYVIEVRRLDNNIKFALLSMVTLPPVVVFLLFQKYIVRGLHLGGVKG